MKGYSGFIDQVKENISYIMKRKGIHKVAVRTYSMMKDLV